MEEVLHLFAHYLALLLDGLALLVLLVGTIEAIIGLGGLLATRASNTEKRAVWLQFANWLAAALTFQLGADIVQTTLTPTWDDIGRVAAIAAIRTFLVYFLDRDIESMRQAQREAATRASGCSSNDTASSQRP